MFANCTTNCTGHECINASLHKNHSLTRLDAHWHAPAPHSNRQMPGLCATYQSEGLPKGDYPQGSLSTAFSKRLCMQFRGSWFACCASVTSLQCQCCAHEFVARAEGMHEFVARANATARGFEPLRAEPNGFRVHHLNHSVTLSWSQALPYSQHALRERPFLIPCYSEKKARATFLAPHSCRQMMLVWPNG